MTVSKLASAKRLQICVSSCLLGNRSRYDGDHTRDSYVTDILSGFFDFTAVCPELEVGMGGIREPVQLEGSVLSPRLIGTKSRHDWTVRMNRYAVRRLKKPDLTDISGFILKKKSPSCGIQRVKLLGPNGRTRRIAVGLFAAMVTKKLPDIPITDEGLLNDPGLRENFIVRIFAYDQLRRLFAGRFRQSEVAGFHDSHKCLLMAHHPETARELDRLVDQINSIRVSEFRYQYRQLFMKALSYSATVTKNMSVLKRIAKLLTKHIGAYEIADIGRAIEDYQREQVPLVVPLTLIRHYVDKHQVRELQDQAYLYPNPNELMLCNRV